MRIVTAVIFACAASVLAQDVDKVTVPFSDAARPKTLRVEMHNGSITVRGYEGKDAVVEVRQTSGARKDEPRADGLRRIHSGSGGVDIEERDNVIRIEGHPSRSSGVTVQVPMNTALKLETHNSSIEVENITGDIEASSHNGHIRVRNVNGSVVANTSNGEVNVVFDRVTGTKPMSFSTLNGKIDVTLPPDVKARLKMKTNRGDVWSDFDVKLEPNTESVKVDDERSNRGRYRVRIDRSMVATINGGGQEMQFTTMNGSVFIRKKK